jgi:hypothetical protein
MKRCLPIIFSAILVASCASTRALPPPSESAGEYRELQGELSRQQADIAIAGQKIEDQGRGLVEDLARLEEAMATAPDAGETERLYWLSRIQAAKVEAEVHQADILDLNRRLAAERETVKKQNQKFNDYEIEMVEMLSDRNTENTRLKVENKAVKGQRNTLLLIVIVVVGAALAVVVFKVCRFFKVLLF